jgi:hypothetical protein
MSAVRSLSGGKRTWRLPGPTSEIDPDGHQAESAIIFCEVRYVPFKYLAVAPESVIWYEAGHAKSQR